MDPDCLTRHVSVAALSYRASLRKLARKMHNVGEDTRRTRRVSLQTAQSELKERKEEEGTSSFPGSAWERGERKLSSARSVAENRVGRPRQSIVGLQIAGRKSVNGCGNDILANGGNLGQDGGEVL